MISLKILIYTLTVFVILAVSISIYILYFVIDDIEIRILGTAGLALVVFAWLWIEYTVRARRRQAKPSGDTPIKRLILMSPDGEKEKEWHCEGITSFLIGKGTVNQTVDIELGDTHYNDYISNEHAVLNRIDDTWYIEDLGSLNGVGIRKRGEEYTLRLKPSVAYKMDEGDILYISKAKILVR